MEILVNILLVIFIAVQAILAIYLLLPAIFLVLHYIVPKGRKMLERKYPVVSDRDHDFAAIITAHQDTRFIAPLVDSFTRQNYNNFIVYVVADDCDISSLRFDDPRICVLKPEYAFPRSNR